MNKRVCAYVRVSTDSADQENSFESQMQYFANHILSNPEWDFVGIYADEGISGTSVKNRKQFNLMMDKVKTGKIDLILVKSISRFARNTADFLTSLRMLRENNVEAYFEKENIYASNPSLDLLITCMAGFAEQESASISENQRWGINKRWESGSPYMYTKTMLGYAHDAEGNLIIDEEEAKTVRRIYELYVSGIGCNQIVHVLEKEGRRNGHGITKWNVSNVIKIIRNEKYKGDYLCNKKYRPAPGKQCVENKGEKPQYYIEGHHEAIVSKELWDEANRIADERGKKIKRKETNMKKEENLLKFIYCPKCGKTYRKVTYNKSSSYAKDYLSCNSNRDWRKCDSCSYRFDKVLEGFDDAYYWVLSNKDYVLDELRKVLEIDSPTAKAKQKVDDIGKEIEKKQNQLLDIDDRKENFYLALKEKIKDEIKELRKFYAQAQCDWKTALDTNFILESYSDTLDNHALTFRDIFSYAVAVNSHTIYLVISPSGYNPNVKLSDNAIGFLEYEWQVRLKVHKLRIRIIVNP